MDIENMSIEKATERCKALTNPEKGCWIGISNQKAIGTVLEELENKQDNINILQAQRDSMEYQFKQAKAELEKKDKVINEMATYIIRNVSREKIEGLTELKDKEVIWSYDIKEYFTNKVEREGK